MPSPIEERARRILDELESVERAWNYWVMLDDDAPAWFGPLVTQLIYAIGDAPIEYSETVVPDENPGSLTLYTDALAIRAELPAKGDHNSRTRLLLRGRRDLRSVVVTGGTDFMDERDHRFPGRLQIELDYGDGLRFALPTRVPVAAEQRVALMEFSAQLYLDLANGEARS